MEYITSGKEEGAKVHLGGERWGTEGFYIQPTIFTETNKDMKIVQEEIFGPVGVVIKFSDDEDVVRQANDTIYGLAAAMFTKKIDRALTVAQKLRAGTTWVCTLFDCLWDVRLAAISCRSTARTSSTLRFPSAVTSSPVSAVSSASTLSSSKSPFPPLRILLHSH